MYAKSEREHTIQLDTLKILATNEIGQCKYQGDRHYGAAWAYHDIAVRVFGNDDAKHISDIIYSDLEKLKHGDRD